MFNTGKRADKEGFMNPIYIMADPGHVVQATVVSLRYAWDYAPKALSEIIERPHQRRIIPFAKSYRPFIPLSLVLNLCTLLPPFLF